MARYFFDIDDGARSVRDEEGVEATLEEVRREVICLLPDMARHELPDGDHRIFTVSVRDEKGHVIFKAALSFNADWMTD
jgi:hypothetical protein